MSKITYVVGDVTLPFRWHENRRVVVAHACNDGGGWGAGVSGAISGRWPHAETAYRAVWHSGALRPGISQLVQVDRETYVANLVTCHVVTRGARGWLTRVNLRWLERALTQLAEQTRDNVLGGASVHMPRVGCGLAGGRWDEVEPLIQRTLVAADVPVAVYDLPGSRDVQRLGG